MMGGKSDVDAAEAAAALADPLRFHILSRLLDGPLTVAEIVADSGASQPNVSNHLAVLRRRRLVSRERRGRRVLYRLAGPPVGQLVEALAVLAAPTSRPSVPAPVAAARTCYDHLAGRLGVAVLKGLRRTDAVRRPGRDGAIDIGTQGERIFARLGVDLSEAAAARRRFAYACVDWTEKEAHLGGALGAAVCAASLRREWVRRRRGTRAVVLTERGLRGFERVLGVSLRASGQQG
jgi:DNA-binding transcriptional ArsR family regulator